VTPKNILGNFTFLNIEKMKASRKKEKMEQFPPPQKKERLN
jgi:hypothetical protein